MDCEVADQVSMEQMEAEQSASPKRKAAPLAFDEELNTVIMSSELTAKYFGVSQQTLSNWVRAGCPRYKYGFYDLREVSEYRFKVAGPMKTPESERDLESLPVQQQKLFYEQRLKAAQAEAAEYKNEIAKGEYLPREQVVNDLRKFCVVLKRSLQGLGRRISRDVASQLGPVEARKFDRTIKDMLAPHSFSSAGAAKSYEYWARTADPAVADAKAASPSAGVVNVTVLMDGGKIPTAAQLKAVENVLSAQTVRPLGIQVTLGSRTVAALTALIESKLSLDIAETPKRSGTGRWNVTAVYNNSMIQTGFYFREWGIFAQDPDTQGEVLVFYANSGDSADFIPAFDGTGSTTASYIEERLICAVAVGNAAVTAVLSSEQYASYDDLQDHVADADNPHKVTKAQVGLGSVDNTSDVDKPVSTAQAAAIAACKVSVKSVTMLAASWVGSDPYTQQVVVDGAAANSKVDIQLSAEQHAALGDLGIDFLQIENANGTLTAKVKGGKPTSDLTVQVTIVGVVQ